MWSATGKHLRGVGGVAEVRREQMANIRKWIDAAKAHGPTVHHRDTAESTHEHATFRKPSAEHILGSN